jgi:hypothetical protein
MGEGWAVIRNRHGWCVGQLKVNLYGSPDPNGARYVATFGVDLSTESIGEFEQNVHWREYIRVYTPRN